MSRGNGFTEDTDMFKDRRSPATAWQRWEGPIKTAVPIIVSLFMAWHQIEKRLDLQEQRLTQQSEIYRESQDRLEKRLELLEVRVYSLTSAINSRQDAR